MDPATAEHVIAQVSRLLDAEVSNQNRKMGRQTELRERLNAPDLTVRQAGSFLIIETGGKTIEIGAMATDDEIEAAFKSPEAKVTITVSTPLERLKGKFLRARGVAQRVASNMEAEADDLIAQEDAMKAKTTHAFAPHKAILAEASNELKAIEDALNLMSNGGPALDPLPASGNTESAN